MAEVNEKPQAQPWTGYRYHYGDQPLPGYTIQHAAGRGGFGEVYYALSDSGRQIALKVIQQNAQIEVRGISQCMNLKSPHLVSIFDIQYNAENVPFVIMEYVSGPSLRQLMEESPTGMGTQKAAFFLREIAKGLSYLHDCGIVHRDLKPSNIFFENSYVKIGDYGLSKAIAASPHSSQTITVGTVHYMAPEIGRGRYDRSIDIYALGIVLYELLTGQVPYFGSSPGEILMKHISEEPDLSGIEEPFASVIRKALAKDPDVRYQTVQEMVEDVFGTEHIRNSVSHFSPESLSHIAEQVARRVGGGGSGTRAVNAAKEGFHRTETPTPDSDHPAGWAQEARQCAREFAQEARKHWGKSHGKHQEAPSDPPHALADPLRRSHRRILAIMAALCVTLGVAPYALFSNGYSGSTRILTMLTGLMIAGATIGACVARFRFLKPLESEASWFRRFLVAGCALILSTVLSLSLWREYSLMLLGGTIIAMAIPFLLMDWYALTNPRRKWRVRLSSLIACVIHVALTGLVLRIFEVPFVLPIAIAVTAGTVVAVQAYSEFFPVRPAATGAPPSAQEPLITPPPPEPAGPMPHENTPATPRPAANQVPPIVSPFKRAWAILLSAGGLVCLCGLQRFYVGRIGSGILWLCTVGWLGIGQIIDVIMIASGRFRDKNGHPLVMWWDRKELDDYQVTSANQPETPRRSSASMTAIGSGFDFGHFILSSIASALIFAALLVGTTAAMHLPTILMTVEPDIAGELTEEFGPANWPNVAEKLVFVVTLGLFFAAAALTVIVRRKAGEGHMFRGLIGLTGLLLTLAAFGQMMPNQLADPMVESLQSGQFGPFVEYVINSMDSRLVPVGLVFLGSVLCLSWPSKEEKSQRRVEG